MRRLASILLIAVVALPAGAQRSGEEILERVKRQYQRLAGCSVVLATRQTQTETQLIKPSSFAFGSERADRLIPVAWSDGEIAICASPGLGRFVSRDGGGSFEELHASETDPVAEALGMIAGSRAALALLSEEPIAELTRAFGPLEYGGVTREGREVLHRFVATAPGPEGEPVETILGFAAAGVPWLVTLQDGDGLTTRFSEWRVRARLSPSLRVEPKDRWTRTDDLAGELRDSLRSAAQAPTDNEVPEPGESLKAAPQFELGTLDNSTFSLAAQRGKVVVLDFWATWCGPCVKGLPTVTRVIEGYSPSDVVFVGVNLREQSPTVRTFMRARGWDFTVAMDTDGAVARSYGVSGIPHSVMIDAQGRVRHVHVGFGNEQEYERRMRQEIDALLRER